MCSGPAKARGAHSRVRPDARGCLLEAGGRMDQELQGPGRGRYGLYHVGPGEAIREYMYNVHTSSRNRWRHYSN
jgi:hypothetical protein